MQGLQRKQTIPYVNLSFTSIEHQCAIKSHIILPGKTVLLKNNSIHTVQRYKRGTSFLLPAYLQEKQENPLLVKANTKTITFLIYESKESSIL